jgi:mono/diheme cytochrome c family protein
MSMQKLLIFFALSVYLVASTDVNSNPARATDGGRQVAEKNSSSGLASGHPTGDAKRGEELYKASCVVCHGARAEGGVGPKLAGNPILSNDQAFWRVVHEGRHVMPPLKGTVSDQQLNDIRAWLRTLP